MIQWTLYILLQYMYNICHYIHTRTHAFLVSHRHRRYIRRGKCSYRYVYCYMFIWMIIYIYIYLWLCQCRQKSELRNPSHDTKHTKRWGGWGVQVVVFPFPPGFFWGDPSFHKSRFKTLPALRRRGKSQPMRRSNRAGLYAATDSVDEMAHDHISGMWKKLQQKMNI